MIQNTRVWSSGRAGAVIQSRHVMQSEGGEVGQGDVTERELTRERGRPVGQESRILYAVPGSAAAAEAVAGAGEAMRLMRLVDWERGRGEAGGPGEEDGRGGRCGAAGIRLRALTERKKKKNRVLCSATRERRRRPVGFLRSKI